MGLVRVVPLGGCGEIGKNCTVVETDDGMIVIDVGISFPHEEQHGVDIVIPDFSFLTENADKVKGVFLTHAHEDHVGALGFLLPHLTAPVYATPFTVALVSSKLEERGQAGDVAFQDVEPGATVEVDGFQVEFVRVTHSIPETCALAIKTEHGTVLFTADFKFDPTPVDKALTDTKRLKELGEEGVVVLLSDSTNVDRPGWGPSESSVSEGLFQAMRQAEGRVLVTMFASNIHRMQQVFDVAYKLGRKVAVTGRRMESTIELCKTLGYLNIRKGTQIPLEECREFHNNEICVLVTGSQGEPMAALSQMSKETYSRLRIVQGDTVLYSARPIPGNEGAIWRTVNRLVALGAHVVTETELPIHVSGHAYADEISEMLNLTSPFYLAPVHGEPRHQASYEQLAHERGMPGHRVFRLRNGDALVLGDEDAWIEQEYAPASDVLIDQHGNVPVTDRVLNERTALGQDGVLVVSMAVSINDGALVARPEAVARGFSGPGEAVEDALDDLCNALAKLGPRDMRDVARLEKLVAETVRYTVRRACRQTPVVVPVVCQVR